MEYPAPVRTSFVCIPFKYAYILLKFCVQDFYIIVYSLWDCLLRGTHIPVKYAQTLQSQVACLDGRLYNG